MGVAQLPRMRATLRPLGAFLLGLLLLGVARALPPVAAKLQLFIDRHEISGAVTLIGDKDNVLSLETVGLADVAAKRPMTDDTLFWIASMTKSVTGTAVMLLVSDGKLSVDDPVEKYLPEFKGQQVDAGPGKPTVKQMRLITIRDLLTHTSGVIPHSVAEDHSLDRVPQREAVASYARVPLRFQAGNRYEYSNGGINTAGRIVEVVSGMPFDRFLEERLFRPLGMKDTTFWPNTEQLKRLAKSYRPSADGKSLVETPIDQLTYPLSDPRRGGAPAGGLFSTAHDLYLLGRMVLNGGSYGGRRYLTSEAVTQMTSNQIGNLPMNGPDLTYGYGLGWIVHRLHPAGDPTGPGTFGAGGAYNTQMGIDPVHNLISVMLVQEAGSPEADRQALRATFTQAAEDAAQARLAEYAGVYALDAHRHFTAVVDPAGGLRIRLTGQPFFHYGYVGQDRFYSPGFAAEFTFNRDAAGHIERVTMRQSWMEMIARRSTGPAPTVLFLAPEKLQAYVGVYEFSPGSRFEITAKGDQLYAQLPGQPAFPVDCDRPDHFAYEVINATVNFERDADGTITALSLDQGPRSTRATRIVAGR